jgi:4-hydroxy-tetrahydrodipicolinate reductase
MSSPAPLRVVIAGSKGRMGQALLACAGRLPNLVVSGQIDQGEDLAPLLGGADVVIDFTVRAATFPLARLCAQAGKALVIGTTGHEDAERVRIAELKSRIPIVWSANYSTGVNTLFWLTRKAAEILGPGFDLEVVEMHHRHKQDAPSGTAATLAAILAEVRGLQTREALRHGRAGITGARTDSEIGVHALRGGDVVGDHTVIFATAGERVELTHKASSRDTLALGALRAACWAVRQPPGLYDMQDVLGLR